MHGMEIIVLIGCVIVILLVLGVSIEPLFAIVFWGIFIVSILCVLFFLVSLVGLLLAKNKKANYVELMDGEKMGAFAIYEIDGEQYRNLFPTDRILENLLYKKNIVKVKVGKWGENTYVYDPVTKGIILTGFVAFSLIAILVYFGILIG